MFSAFCVCVCVCLGGFVYKQEAYYIRVPHHESTRRQIRLLILTVQKMYIKVLHKTSTEI